MIEVCFLMLRLFLIEARQEKDRSRGLVLLMMMGDDKPGNESEDDNPG